jgi:hypothetical protein
MIEVFDTAAARAAPARRKLRCPDCGAALRPRGRVRERSVRSLNLPLEVAACGRKQRLRPKTAPSRVATPHCRHRSPVGILCSRSVPSTWIWAAGKLRTSPLGAWVRSG